MILYYNFFAQNIEECGLDNNPKLTTVEAEFLNKYMSEELRNGLDFHEKKAIFVTRPAASRLGSKSEYFKNIKMWKEDGKKIGHSVYKLNEKEKNDTGGYDIIICYWVKVLTKRRKKKIIKQFTIHYLPHLSNYPP